MTLCDDVSPADWLVDRTSDRRGLSGIVPGGYPAYVRICHDASGPAGRVTWADVAAATGRVGGRPSEGDLDQPQLASLVEILAPHTGTADNCWFCLWIGWGWLSGGPSVAVLRSDGSDTPVPASFGSDVLQGPQVRLPGREYLLFNGPLRAAVGAGWEPEPGFRVPQSPNLFWPDDRSWCVATEIDFDSTLVGGSGSLIDDILSSDRLDAWPVSLTDSLTVDADRINGES